MSPPFPYSSARSLRLKRYFAAPYMHAQFYVSTQKGNSDPEQFSDPEQVSAHHALSDGMCGA